jgi:hypothetical protein
LQHGRAAVELDPFKTPVAPPLGVKYLISVFFQCHEADDIEVGVLKTSVWNPPDSYLTDALSYALQGIRGAEILSVRVMSCV